MAQKVLIADDGLASRLLFEKVLTREGYDVISVGSGTEVVDRVKEKLPDIALIDAIMPEVDGYQICETLKNHPNFKNLPIILLTGQHENIDRDRGIDLVGSSAILSKPAKSTMIISMVKDMLEAQKAESAEPATTITEQAPETEVIEEPPFVEEGYEFDEDSEEADLVVESEILDEEIESEIFEEEEEIEEIEDFAQEEEYEQPEPEAAKEVLLEEPPVKPAPQVAKTPAISAQEALGTGQLPDEKLDLIADEIARRVAGKLVPALMQELANSFMQLPVIKDVVENTSKNLVKDLLKDKS